MQSKSVVPEAPVPSQRFAQREDTRRRLLAVARKLFRAKGVEHVSIADIAASADVSRATIYVYFSGKPPMLEALLEEDWAGQLKLFDRLLEVDINDTGQLSAWVLRVAEGMRRARDSFGIHWAALGQNPALTARHHEHRTVLSKALLRAFPNGEELNISRAVEAEMIVAELENFATSAAVGWGADEIAAALPLIIGRMGGLRRTQRSDEPCRAEKLDRHMSNKR